MAREPTYPEDAPIGAKRPAADDQPAPSSEAATRQVEQGKPAESRRKKHLVAGAAIGIGSAAIVAALLYANRGRGRDQA